jgi:15-cis-phytoene desaturase
MAEYDAIVVGAGLAGLSCALELTEARRRVLVLEAESYVGGRTSSWTEADGMKVESGLHRVLGVYRAFPRMLEQAGLKVDDVVVWEDEVEFRQPEPKPSAVFSTSFAHRPLQTMAGALLHNDYLPPLAKASAAKLFAAGLADYAARPRELDQVTILEYARQRDVHELVIDHLLRPLTAGIFFIPAERYSAYAFFGLIGPYMPSLAKMSVGAFRGGMTDVMAEPIATHLRLRGTEVRVNAPVTDFILDRERVAGVVAAGEAIRAGHVVLAVPLDVAQKLARPHWANHAWFQPMLSLRTMPAATLQIELDAPSMEVDHTTFGVGTSLACFSEQSRTTFTDTDGRLSIILAPSDDFIGLPPPRVLEIALADADRLGLRVRGHVKNYRVVNHPADFYALEPRQDDLRPEQATPVHGLTLAGDYTKQEYLATMEGAVVSGRLAAGRVLKVMRPADA